MLPHMSMSRARKTSSTALGRAAQAVYFRHYGNGLGGKEWLGIGEDADNDDTGDDDVDEDKNGRVLRDAARFSDCPIRAQARAFAPTPLPLP